MFRTTKALARLGTLAIIAGSALSTPFALGTASAITPTVSAADVTITNGNIDSTNEDAHQDAYTSGVPGSVAVAGADLVSGDTLDFTLVGAGAYFVKGSAGAHVHIDSATTAHCNVTGAQTCGATQVGDDTPEAASLVIVDTTSGTEVDTTVGFNAVEIQGCTSTGYETATGYASPQSPSAVNCETQAQLGVPITESLTYVAGGVGVAGASLQIQLVGGPNMQFTASQPTGTVLTTLVPPFEFATCTTQAGGVCNVTFEDTNPTPETGELVTGQITAAVNYPQVGPGAPPVPTQLLNFVAHSVVPYRMDLINSTVIAPTTQDSVSQSLAEPGDVIQNTYLVRGNCSIPAGDVNCDTGQPLAGVSMSVAVTGASFFTPNCVSPASTGGTPFAGLNNYNQCTFATTPTAGSQTGAATGAGSLKNSGQTQTVTTDLNGEFTVSLGITRDPAFDANGLSETVAVTGNGLPSLNTGAQVSGSCSGETLVGVPKLGGGLSVYTGSAGCPEDVQWTTREKPLNGGTAKFVVIPSLSQPNNTAIQTENNFTVDDTKTWNVPDVDRVDFVVHVTDSFGNLTQEADGSSVGQPLLTKTGPGATYFCGGFSATSACSSSGGLYPPASIQPDGTYKQSGPVVGSYLNNTVDTGGQWRYQADSTSAGAGILNLGYPCTAGFAGSCVPGVTTAQPGVGDGTQTDALTWSPPTTTWSSYTLGTPSTGPQVTGTATAQSDTLTLNFYNQLAQAVVTFGESPGKTVSTSTAVTVTATVLDQNGNPIVNQIVDALRSGANESSCVPAQTVGNGGGLSSPLVTNTSGVAGYTFSCNAAGVSTVSMVVEGPGGTQLAQGNVPITFTGAGTHTTVERPNVTLTSFHAHHLTVHVSTRPALGASRTVNVYRLVNGLRHLVGQTHTGPAGRAALTLAGLRSGATWRVTVNVVKLGTQYRSEYSTAVQHKVK